MFFNYVYQRLGNIQIHTTGCGLCIYDANCFANTLNKNSKSIIFNTCSFIEQREIENHLLLNLLKKAFADYKFYILGCDINNNYEKYKGYGELIFNEDLRQGKYTHKINNRLSIKIQDGCCHKCSYCIINKLRNKPYSTPYKDIYEQLSNSNGNEIELSATEFCNYYDKETDMDVTKLLKQIVIDFPNISHISFPSLDPASSKVEEIIDIVSQNPTIFNQHIYLATQSVNNDILKLMRRRHTKERLIELHQYAKKHNISVGWEIIVGFPSETEEQFNEVYELMKELKPCDNTIFIYSPRKGTDAYEMLNQIDEKTKSKRQSLLLSLDETPAWTINNNLYEIKKKMLESSSQIEIDLFDEEQLANFIRYGSNDCILIVRYNEEKPLESKIYINFIKEYFRDIPIIVKIKKGVIEDIKSFEQQYKAKVVLE